MMDRRERVALVRRELQGCQVDLDEEIVGTLPGDQAVMMKRKVLWHAATKARTMPHPSCLSHLSYPSHPFKAHCIISTDFVSV